MANSYLNRTLGTSTNAYKGTVSHWIKRSGLGAMGTFAAWNNGGTSTERAYLNMHNDTIYFYDQANSVVVQTNRVFRDTSAWYHIVVAWDTSQSTASDRVKIYVNGVQETSFANSDYPSQNSTLQFNTSGRTFGVGCYAGSGAASGFFDGYISHFAFVDGLQLTPTTFGSTDATSGIWKFKPPSGVTWGTNGVHLKFENSGALGTDSSGNTNTYTVNGNLKQALDTPSNVHATLNPLDKSIAGTAPTISNGNNSYQSSGNGVGNNNAVRGTLGVSSGKWYWEAKYVNAYQTLWGMQDSDASGLGWDSGGYWFGQTGSYGVNAGGTKTINGSTSSSFSAMSAGNIIGLAYDLDNGKFYVSVNGTFVTSGDPTSGATGTGAIGDIPTGKFYLPIVGNGDYGQQSLTHFNFGNGFFGTTAITSAVSIGNGSLFEYDVPSGFYALNTKNINTYG